MTSERWEQIQELFTNVLELPTRQRTTFLETACRGDAGLLEEVSSLLEAAEPLYRQALSIRRRTLGETHEDVATSLGHLATLAYFTDDLQAAE